MKIMTMKRNIFVKGLASLAVAAGLAGCSSDYLEVVPETSVDASSVQTTVEGARSAMYGACRSMYAQYSELDGYNSFNGESWVSMFYGEVFGQDYFSLLWAARSGSNYTWVNNTSYMGWTCSLAWRYCYNLVNQCNVILDGIDNIEGDKNELDLIKAEALTRICASAAALRPPLGRQPRGLAQMHRAPSPLRCRGDTPLHYGRGADEYLRKS